MAGEKTAYHVLLQIDGGDRGPVFAIVGRDIDAHSAENAVRIYAEKAGDAIKGGVVLVAVPARSWRPFPVAVETQTVVKLGEAA